MTRYSYDAQGNELTTTDALGAVTTRTFETAKKRLLSESDPLGHTLSYSYEANGDPSTITDANGNSSTWSYFGNGTRSLSEPLGRSTLLGLDGSGNLDRLSIAGQLTRYAYNAKGQRIAETDPAGSVITYTLDAEGNETGRSWQRTLDTGATVTLTRARSLDAKGRVVSETDALGFKTQTTYDAAGNVIAQTDAAGRSTQFEYDARGRLTKTTYPDGSSETSEYDPEGNEIARTDRAGRITRYEYDALNRLTRTIQPDGSARENSYDAAGRLIRSLDANGNSVENTYDAAGRLTRVSDALGRVTSYAYDANGNRTRVSDALGRETRFEYDALNRLIKTIWPDGRESHITWRLDGRKASQTDPNGNTTAFGYDALGRLTQVTQSVGGIAYLTTYGYDELGNKVSHTDAEGRTTRWAYDNQGRVTRRTLPQGQFETFAYDASGNVTAHTDFNGATTRTAYDANDRPTLKLHPDGAKVSWTYTASGQVASISDARGTTRYQYDANDRLTRITQPDATYIAYGYDASGNRTELTTPSGTARYEYDANHRLIKVIDASGEATTYAYDAAGNKTQVAYPNGTRTEYAYDALNRILAVAHIRLEADASRTLLLGLRYTLAASGHRTKIEEFAAPATFDPATGFTGTPIRTTDYQYDSLYRLTQEKVTDASGTRTTDWTYDKVGNRLTQTVSPAAGNSTVTTYFYDANDRLTREEASQGAATTVTTYAYDHNGNTVARSTGAQTTTYRYDADNRLIEVKQGATADTAQTIASYAYDGNGNRVTKTETSAQGLKTTSFLVDENQQYAQVVEERETLLGQPVQVTAAYLYGDDLLNQIRGNRRSYYHYDGLGCTRALSNETGTLSDSYNYEVFGNLGEQVGNTPNAYRFTGEQFDPITGLYYLRARYYNPSIGRFSERDRFDGFESSPPSLNKYSYAHADPANGVDPAGSFLISDVMARDVMIGAQIQSAAAIGATTVARRFLWLLALYTAASVAGTYFASDRMFKTFIEECVESSRRGENKCKPRDGMFIVGDDYHEVRDHVGDALRDQKQPALSRQKPSHPRTWRNHYKGPGKPCSNTAGTDCDEYPFAGSIEGGEGNYLAGRVSLRSVNLSQNRGAGSQLGWFYTNCNVPPNTPSYKYKVMAVRGLPRTGYVCPR